MATWSLPSWKRRALVDQPSKLSERDFERPLLALGLVSPAGPLRHLARSTATTRSYSQAAL